MTEGVRRRRVLAGVATAALTGIGSLPATSRARQQTPSDGWPMFGHDTASTGHAPDQTGTTVELISSLATKQLDHQATRDRWSMSEYDAVNTGHAPDQTGHTTDVTDHRGFQTGNEVLPSPVVVDGSFSSGINQMYASGETRPTYASPGIILPGTLVPLSGIFDWIFVIVFFLFLLSTMVVVLLLAGPVMVDKISELLPIDTGDTASDSLDGRQTKTSRAVDFIGQAESARKRAKTAMGVNKYTRAVETYERALNRYQKAKANLPADDNRHQDIEAAIKELEAGRQEAIRRRDQRANLRERLAAAEEDFAVAAHEYIQGDETVARVRYRQARDRYDNLLAELEREDFDRPLTVSFDHPERPPLQAIAGLDESTVGRLADANLASPSVVRKAKRETLTAIEGIDQQVAARLAAWSTIREDDTFEIDSIMSLRQRRDRAARGVQQCR